MSYKKSWKNRSVRNQKDITLNDFANSTVPKGRPKKSTSNVGFVDAKISDITLNDFANSPVCKNRLKKSTNNVMTVLKKFEEEKSWDAKPEDFEGDFIEQEDEGGNVIYVLSKSEPRRRKKTISGPSEDGQGNVYPVDIWFLLSKYIRPEDVGRFAGICKMSFEVVCSAQFWYGMYKRYYNSSINLPEELQMESMFKKYGLRASVVRALHYMYPAYVDRLKTISSATFEIHPAVLQKRICESLWYTKKINWIYYFKMKEKGADNILNHSKTTFKRPDLLEILDDVSANPDESCCVLQVFCKEFAAVPPVIGQILTSVSVTLSNGFRYHRLQMSFGSGIQMDDTSTIILDPVINYKVLNWWHPHYPHNSSIRDLLSTDEVI